MFVADVIERLVAANGPQDVVMGGRNLMHLKRPPKALRRGSSRDSARF
jgi:hypothetical protein